MLDRKDGEKQHASGYPVVSLLKRIMQLFRDRLDDQLRPFGVTAAQLHVLAALEREPGISGARLARCCMVTPQTTQVLLRGIEANGWIKRRKHPENDRILLVTLTQAGQQKLARSRTAVGHLYEAMLDGFTGNDSGNLERLLALCVTNLEHAARPDLKLLKSERSRLGKERSASRLGI